MKKLILLFSFTLTGCGGTNLSPTSYVKGIPVVDIDGCEYIKNSIYCQGIWSYVYTHKGNCNNKIHK
jgi:hypothetical protein